MRRHVLAALLLLAALLAACGSGDGKKRSTPIPTAVPGTPANEVTLPLRPDQSAVYSVNADGTGLRKLLDADEDIGFAVSPDGDSVAVGSTTGDASSLRLLDAATGDLRRKVSLPGRLGVRGWSPDGTWLALQGSRPSSTVYVYSFQEETLNRLARYYVKPK